MQVAILASTNTFGHRVNKIQRIGKKKSTSMSNYNRVRTLMPERNRQRNQMQQYLQRDNNIRNEGYIDEIKMPENIRILVLNPNRLDPWNDYKMYLFKDSIERHNIDIIMLNEINIKWTIVNKNKMK